MAALVSHCFWCYPSSQVCRVLSGIAPFHTASDVAFKAKCEEFDLRWQYFHTNSGAVFKVWYSVWSVVDIFSDCFWCCHYNPVCSLICSSPVSTMFAMCSLGVQNLLICIDWPAVSGLTLKTWCREFDLWEPCFQINFLVSTLNLYLQSVKIPFPSSTSAPSPMRICSIFHLLDFWKTGFYCLCIHQKS